MKNVQYTLLLIAMLAVSAMSCTKEPAATPKSPIVAKAWGIKKIMMDTDKGTTEIRFHNEFQTGDSNYVDYDGIVTYIQSIYFNEKGDGDIQLLNDPTYQHGSIFITSKLHWQFTDSNTLVISYNNKQVTYHIEAITDTVLDISTTAGNGNTVHYHFEYVEYDYDLGSFGNWC